MADDDIATVMSSLDSTFGADRDKGDSSDGDDYNSSDSYTDEEGDVSDASEETPDGDDDTSDSDGDESSADGDEPEESVEEPEQKEEVEEEDGDATDKELAELGIKKPKKGQRENKLPYTAMKRIFGNAKKKWDAGVQTQIKEYSSKVENYESELSKYAETDKLLQSDGDRFIRVLAQFHPHYQKFVDFLDGKGAPAQQQQQEARYDANDPEPEPDFEYPDGSKGYTQKGFQAHQAWTIRQASKQATAAARAEWEKELKPIKEERERQAKEAQERRQFEQQHQQRQERVTGQITRARKVWGDDVLSQNKDAILAALQADKTLEFSDAVASVMLPKLKASRGTIHAEVVGELKKRPGLASKTEASGTKRGTKKPASEMSDEELVMETLREQGLVK